MGDRRRRRWRGVSLGTLVLLSATPAFGQALRYHGRDAVTGHAWIERTPGFPESVREGDEVPGWGRVTAVGEEQLQLEQVLTEGERETLRAQGAVPLHAREFVVPREDRLTAPRSWP